MIDTDLVVLVSGRLRKWWPNQYFCGWKRG